RSCSGRGEASGLPWECVEFITSTWCDVPQDRGFAGRSRKFVLVCHQRRCSRPIGERGPQPWEGAPLRIALLSYRSLPTCGGQGVYVRQLSKELIGLGHEVTVVSGPPYPDLVDGVGLQRLPSLDLWAEYPFRWPKPGELRDFASVTEFAMMRTGQFSEPLAFSLRAHKQLKPRR